MPEAPRKYLIDSLIIEVFLLVDLRPKREK